MFQYLDDRQKLLKESALIIDEDSANSYAVLNIDDKVYGLSWYGKSNPKIEIIKSLNIVLIGAGSTVVFLSIKTGVNKFCLSLHTPFSFFVVDKQKVIIVSETTITIVNLMNYTLEKFSGVPDIITDVKIVNDKIIVIGMDDQYEF